MTTRSIFFLATLGAVAANSLGRRDELDSGNADKWPPCTSLFDSPYSILVLILAPRQIMRRVVRLGRAPSRKPASSLRR